MSGSDVIGVDTANQTVLTISIVSNQLQVTLHEALDHGTTRLSTNRCRC